MGVHGHNSRRSKGAKEERTETLALIGQIPLGACSGRGPSWSTFLSMASLQAGFDGRHKQPPPCLWLPVQERTGPVPQVEKLGRLVTLAKEAGLVCLLGSLCLPGFTCACYVLAASCC